MAITNPKGAAAMTEQLKQENDPQFSLTLDPQSGAVFRINKRSGEVALAGNPLGQRHVADATLLKANDELKNYSQLHGISEQANDLLSKLRDGTLKLGVIKNAENKLKTGLGLSDEESRAYAQWEQFQKQYSFMKQLEAKGVQTEGDAKRAMEMLVGGGASLDEKTAQDALERLIHANGRSNVAMRNMVDSFRAQAPGSPAFDHHIQELNARDKWYADRDAEAEARRKGTTATTTTGGSRILNVR
jgi:hypothetical protein